MTKAALADTAGLTPRRIREFENEGVVPPPATLTKFAEILEFPETFFHRPTTLGPRLGDVSFRSMARLTASKRDAALASAAVAIDFVAWLEERYHLPAPTLPDLREVEPRMAATALRAEWALGNDPAPDIIHLAEAHGIRVFSLTDDAAALDAYSFWQSGVPFMMLTRHKSPERGRWDAAHEIGHLTLHLEMPPQGKEHETEADQFASEFLLPAEGVLATTPRFPTFTDVLRLKVAWRVSALAFIRRIHQLGGVNDWQYRNLVVEASGAGYRRQEGDIDRETSQVIPQVLTFLDEDGLGLQQIANELDVPLKELRGLIFSKFTVLDGLGQPGDKGGGRRTGDLRAL